MKNTSKPNRIFWAIAAFFLLWNIAGMFFWFSEYFLMTEEIKATYTEKQRILMDAAPSWNIYVYGAATVLGAVASILLLCRNKLAIFTYGISLIAILFLQLYWIFILDSLKVMGPQAIIMPLAIIAIAIFEYFYGKATARIGWIS